MVGTNNAVNLTDGLDGLAIGPIVIATASYAILSYVSGHQIANYLKFPFCPTREKLAGIAATIIGTGLGFLWCYIPCSNIYGRSWFSFLGGLLGLFAILSKQELLLVIIGFVFVIEAFLLSLK